MIFSFLQEISDYIDDEPITQIQTKEKSLESSFEISAIREQALSVF